MKDYSVQTRNYDDTAKAFPRKKTHRESSFLIQDNRSIAVRQRQLQEMVDSSFKIKQLETIEKRINGNGRRRAFIHTRPGGNKLLAGQSIQAGGIKAPQQNSYPIPLQLNRRDGYEKVPDQQEDTSNVDTFGKQLVVSYRLLKDATAAIKAKKNRQALKFCALGVMDAGISLATAIAGIPGLMNIGGAGMTLSLAPETLAATGGHTILNLKEPPPTLLQGDLTVSVTDSGSEFMKPATTKKAFKKVVKSKFGSRVNAAKTMVSLVPFVSAIEKFYKSGKLLRKSDEEYNKNKKALIRLMRELVEEMKEKLDSINLENVGTRKVQTANSKIFIRHKTRSLDVILKKYREKCQEFEHAATAFEDTQLFDGDEEGGNDESVSLLHTTHTSSSPPDQSQA